MTQLAISEPTTPPRRTTTAGGRRLDWTHPETLARLCTLGFAKMLSKRKTRTRMLATYSSRFYGDGGLKNLETAFDQRTASPMNLVHQAVTTLVPNLVFNNPKADLSAPFVAYRSYADIGELALNQLIDEIKMKETLRKVVTNSIFLAGFSKTGLCASDYTLDIEGVLHDPGQPYFDNVDADDILLDPVGREWEEQRLIGNRFRFDLTPEILDSGMYDADVLLALASRYEQGNAKSTEASMLSGRSNTITEADDLTPAVDAVEIWLPRYNVMLTLPWQPSNEVGSQIIREVGYEGPETGPYNMLGYAFVPNNILPVAPVMIWYDLHVLANRIAGKAARQAERQKSVLAYEASSFQDASEVVDADDGEAVKVDNIDGIKEVSYGGVVDDNYRYVEWAKREFAEMAMNVELLSGVASNEPTATQAEMVQANITVRISDMRGMVYDFAGAGMKGLFFYLHTDPLIQLPLIKRVDGADQQVFYTPEMREGDWLDYNIEVKAFSMARPDPNMQIRRLMELIGNIIPALAQAFQMLGPAFNIEKALTIIGKRMEIDDLDEIINSPQLQLQMAVMQASVEGLIPPAMKPVQMATGMAPGAGGMGMGGGRPQQPNPMAVLPSGMTPTIERNQARQETAGEIQASRRR